MSHADLYAANQAHLAAKYRHVTERFDAACRELGIGESLDGPNGEPPQPYGETVTVKAGWWTGLETVEAPRFEAQCTVLPGADGTGEIVSITVQDRTEKGEARWSTWLRGSGFRGNGTEAAKTLLAQLVERVS